MEKATERHVLLINVARVKEADHSPAESHRAWRYACGLPSTTNQSMFEALFDRRLKPSGQFAAELKAAGYDPQRGVPTYPTEVWIRCLEIARRHTWPSLSPADAYRKIGTEFTEGFLETLVGRMVGVAIPFMTPQTFFRRLGNYLKLGRNDAAFRFELTRDERFASDAMVHNPAGVPGTFVAGILDAAMQRMKVQWTIEIDQRSPHDYALNLRWK